MTKVELEQKLDDALKTYLSDVNLGISDPYSKRPVTEGELVEISKQTFYVLNSFKKAILEYLN